VTGGTPALVETGQQFCEWRDCLQRATWCITGQWTIFDWLDVYSCGTHLLDFHRWLSGRTVDGEPLRQRHQQWIGPTDA
jgi:hypothetical protein